MHGVKSPIYQRWEIGKISSEMVCNQGVQFRYVNDDWYKSCSENNYGINCFLLFTL